MPFFFFGLLYSLLFATPNPQFETQVLDDGIEIGYGIALGDVDGDGRMDILLADKKKFVWYRNGDGKKFVMAENLTRFDNVCIAARDLDGDGKVEVAVGAQWNPGETSDTSLSGSVHFLVRPEDPTQLWKVITLPHEPTVHRMGWIRAVSGKYYLLVVPLHGRGNKDGMGEEVQINAYEYPGDPYQNWQIFPLEKTMHLTHNFDIAESTEKNENGFYLAGKEGVRFISENPKMSKEGGSEQVPGLNHGAGEVRIGKLPGKDKFLVTIEPMHGVSVVFYPLKGGGPGKVLDDHLKEGHALAVGDFLGLGFDQVVAGWRAPNSENEMGIKLYYPEKDMSHWQSEWIDKNGMACEDIKVADLDLDGKPDIVASGRSTHNLKIYWNKSR